MGKIIVSTRHHLSCGDHDGGKARVIENSEGDRTTSSIVATPRTKESPVPSLPPARS